LLIYLQADPHRTLAVVTHRLRQPPSAIGAVSSTFAIPIYSRRAWNHRPALADEYQLLIKLQLCRINIELHTNPTFALDLKDPKDHVDLPLSFSGVDIHHLPFCQYQQHQVLNSSSYPLILAFAHVERRTAWPSRRLDFNVVERASRPPLDSVQIATIDKNRRQVAMGVSVDEVRGL